MTDHVVISCPNCSQTLKVRGEYLGRRATCKHCQAVIKLELSHDAGTGPRTEKTEPTHGTGTAFWEPKPADDPEPNLKAEVERLKHYITSVTKERDTLRDDFERARTELTVARESIAGLGSVEAELATTRGDLIEVKSRVERLQAELEAANLRCDRLRDDLQTEHAARHQEALNLAESRRLEAEAWKGRHDHKANEYQESLHEHADERTQHISELQRSFGEIESLKAGIAIDEARRRSEADESRARIDALEQERSGLEGVVAELRNRLDEESRATQAVVSAMEEWKASHADAEASARGVESDTIRALRESAEGLESRLHDVSHERDATKARQTELESALSKKTEEAENYERRLTHAKEFKEQIRTFLSGLGINLPDA